MYYAGVRRAATEAVQAYAERVLSLQERLVAERGDGLATIRVSELARPSRSRNFLVRPFRHGHVSKIVNKFVPRF